MQLNFGNGNSVTAKRTVFTPVIIEQEQKSLRLTGKSSLSDVYKGYQEAQRPGKQKAYTKLEREVHPKQSSYKQNPLDRNCTKDLATHLRMQKAKTYMMKSEKNNLKEKHRGV